MKAAVFVLTSCFGCEFELLNLKEELLKIFKRFDFINFKLLKEKNIEGFYDIVFVEGGVSREEEIREIKEIRERTKFLVALGACACNGCVLTVKNFVRGAEEKVYGKNLFNSIRVDGIDTYVKVDYYLRGCPFSSHELVELVKSLSVGKIPREKDYPVCFECRRNKVNCLLDEKIFCLGPVSRGGCKAICPNFGYSCVGCRGLNPDANLEKLFSVLRKIGMSKKDIEEKLKMYNLLKEIKGKEEWKKLK